MDHLGGSGAYIVAAGYMGVAAMVIVNTTMLLVRRWGCSDMKPLQRVPQRREPGGGEDVRSAAGDGHRSTATTNAWMTVLAVGLCLSVLAASCLELFESKGLYKVHHSKSLVTMIIARAVWAAGIVLWLLLNECYRQEGGSGNGLHAIAAVATAACTCFLGLALLWWAMLLSDYTLGRGVPREDEAFAYVEGFCTVGSLFVMMAACLLRREIISRPEDEVETQVEGALDSAGWVSLLSFSWLNPLFKAGAARQLRPEDLPDLARQDRTTSWADRFAEAVRHERGRPRPSLLRVCWSMFGREFLALGWLKAANVGLGFSGPLLLKVVVKAVQEAGQGDEGNCFPQFPIPPKGTNRDRRDGPAAN